MSRLSAFVLAACQVALLGAAACESSPTTDFHGVKLGMTAGDVRERFRGPAGAWKATTGEEMLLDYSPDTGGAPKVRFEFHAGMLVAIRAKLDLHDPSAAASARREVTPGAVLTREADRQSVSLVWLSRDCPTHKEEAERLVRGAP